MTQLANWGRWGKDDERGAFELITPEKRRQAATAREDRHDGVPGAADRERAISPGAQPRPVNRAGASASVFLIDGDYLFERQEIEYHGSRLSHFDALCHVSYNGKLYNGLNFREVVTADGGCAKLAVTAARTALSHAVSCSTCLGRASPRRTSKRGKSAPGSGSPPEMRCCFASRQPGVAAAGLGAAGYEPSIIPLLKQRDIALLGNDSAQEGGTIPGIFIPIHTFTIVALGLNLLDNLALDELAATAQKLNRWEFMLVVEPLRVQNGAGSPVNPVAVF